MLFRVFSPPLRKGVFLAFFAAMCLFPPPVGAQKTPPLSRSGRDTLTLNGPDWRGKPDPDNRGEAADWQKTIPNDAKAAAIPEPPLPQTAGSIWRWREFQIPAAWKGQTVRLQFGAVSEIADLWLNGIPLGSHTGGALPFEYDITKTMLSGAKNLLALRVKNAPKQPTGIWQAVRCIAHDEAYLLDAFPQAGRAGNLSVPVTLLNTSDKSGDSELDATIFALDKFASDKPDKPKKFVLQSKQNLRVSPGRNVTTLILNARPKNFLLWTPQKPARYVLALDFHQDADSLDKLQIEFGFREFGWKDKTITLNNTPLALKSASYASPPLPLTNPEAQNRCRADLAAFRSSGFNLLFVQAADPILLQIADETGMLLIEGPRPNLPPEVAAEELRGLIVRDRAHPSLLGWNLGAADRSAILLCRDLDPTRFLFVGAGKERRIVPPNQDAPLPLETLLP